MSAKDDGPKDLKSMVRTKRKINKKKARAATQTKPDALDRESESRHQSTSDRMREMVFTSQSRELPPFVVTQQPKKADLKKLHQATDQHDVARGSSSATRGRTSEISARKPHNPEELQKSRDQAAPQSSPHQSALPEDLGDIDLEEIDLRSPSPSSDEDPDYDFIDISEAMHSARNAQPDRADKYPELQARPMQGMAKADSGKTSSGRDTASSSVIGTRLRAWWF